MNKILLLTWILITSPFGRTDSIEGVTAEGKEISCFIYHRVGDHRYPTTNISVKDFEMHLEYLVKNNFQVLSFSDAVAYLKSNGPSRKTAVITIDDGYKSFFKYGLPLLRKYKLPATLFINTKTVGGGDYMDWEELKIALKNGIEIGNHTHSHAFFLNEPPAARYKLFKDEIELSQTLIQKHLDLVPKVFSYPYGEYDKQMIEIVRDAGFVAAAAQNSGVVYEGTDLFMCPRFPMSEAYSSRDQFIEKTKATALQLDEISPREYTMPRGGRPLLTLTIKNTALQLRQLQCFVQGGESEVQILESSPDKIRITVRAKATISRRRRTLYTVTVPDKNGTWHWYSHLWVNSAVN